MGLPNLLILFHFQIQKSLRQLLKLKTNYLVYVLKKLQNFKSHEIKNKTSFSSTKTLLTLRLQNLNRLND
jgi:hypothetical protein